MNGGTARIRRKKCNRICWSQTKAKALVLAAQYFRHNQNRQERDYYYCLDCNAYHTTSE